MFSSTSCHNYASRLCLFFLCFLWITAWAQDPHPAYRIYDVEDGLPSVEVYKVKQDSRGYIWFASNNGVSRFNGYEFENFSMSNGLADNTVFEIFEDAHGTIWFLSLSNKISYYRDGKMQAYRYNQQITEALKKGYLKTSFCVDEKGTVFIGLLANGICEVSAAGKIRRYDQYEKSDSLLIISYEPVKHYALFTAKLDTSGATTLVLKNEQLTSSVNIGEIGILSSLPIITHLKNGKLVFAYDLNLFVIEKDLSYRKITFGSRIQCVYEGWSGRLWVGTGEDGVYEINNLDFDRKQHYLNGLSVASVLEDREQAVWIATVGNSVFYYLSRNMMTCDKESGLENNKVNCLAEDGSCIYVGLQKGFIQKLQRSGKAMDLGFQVNKQQAIYNLYCDRENALLYYSANMGKNGHNGSIDLRQNKLKEGFGFFKVIPAVGGMHWGAYIGSVYRIINGKRDKGFLTFGPMFQRINAIAQKDPRTLLLGCPNGLWQCDLRNGWYEFAGGDEPLLRERILDLAYRKDSALCIATKGVGILIKTKKRIHQINGAYGLSSTNVSKLLLDDSLIWAITDNGLNRISFSGGDYDKPKIRVYNTSDGLPSNAVNDILKFKNKIWLATDKGVCFFHPDSVAIPAVEYPVYITSLQVNEKMMMPGSDYRLHHSENNIRISYVGLGYRQDGKLQYRYRMLGLDTPWIYTSNREVQFTTLPPGDYRFDVSVLNSHGHWTKVPATVTFRVLAPLWKRPWFILLAGIFVIVGLYVSINFRIRKKQSRLYQEKEMQQLLLGLKLKALRSQMNPHFIFNVMNSIQHFIAFRNNDAAQRYLSKFARLIRAILNNSEKNTVPLSDEIRVLELYLDLEKMRFEKEFSYTILVADDIDVLRTEIPSMLLQPYVENAVKHGILPSPKTGLITIEITRQLYHLKCVIEDNGVGRKQSSKHRNPEHRSHGTSITKERLEVINEFYNQKIPETIIDLTNSSGESTGTRVEIYIPFVSDVPPD